MLKLLSALTILTTACLEVEPQDRPETRAALPTVHLVAEPMRDVYMIGAAPWAELGFTFTTADTGMPECPDDWYLQTDGTHYLACQITVTIKVDPHLIEKVKSDGLGDPWAREVVLDDSVFTEHAAPYQHKIVAHEVGHVILQVVLHTSTGVLSGEQGTPLVLSAEDKLMACRNIRVCK